MRSFRLYGQRVFATHTMKRHVAFLPIFLRIWEGKKKRWNSQHDRESFKCFIFRRFCCEWPLIFVSQSQFKKVNNQNISLCLQYQEFCIPIVLTWMKSRWFFMRWKWFVRWPRVKFGVFHVEKKGNQFQADFTSLSLEQRVIKTDCRHHFTGYHLHPFQSYSKMDYKSYFDTYGFIWNGMWFRMSWRNEFLFFYRSRFETCYL